MARRAAAAVRIVARTSGKRVPSTSIASPVAESVARVP